MPANDEKTPLHVLISTAFEGGFPSEENTFRKFYESEGFSGVRVVYTIHIGKNKERYLRGRFANYLSQTAK